MPGNHQNGLGPGRRVAAASTVASCLLAVSNIWIGYAAGSTSVVAAGVEFLGDVLASILVLAGMTLAAKPADAEHPYGHGRIEILAGLSVGIILAAGGLGICFRSLQKVTEVHRSPAVYSIWPLGGSDRDPDGHGDREVSGRPEDRQRLTSCRRVERYR
jgi:cation diffusion facilitator family transporter